MSGIVRMQTASNQPLEASLATAPLGRKVSFFAAILLVIGSSIGAGIFFKSGTVLTDSANNLYWAIGAWLITALTVICAALALLEVAAAAKNNLSFIGWCKAFNLRYVYKGCKYFMTYVYVPVHFFLMAYYVISSLQDSLAGFGVPNNFGTSNDWALWMVIALVITIYFIFVSGLSARFASIQNLIIMVIKVFPLVGVVVIGIVAACLPQTVNNNTVGGVQNTAPIQWWTPTSKSLFGLSPGIGLFGAIGAIFFSYDGFYVASGIQTELKEPKKAPLALVLGLVITTFVYITIAAAVSVSTPGGSFTGLRAWLAARNAGGVFAVISLLITAGILGVINGFATWSSRFIVDLAREGEIPVPKSLLPLIDRPTAVFGTWYMAICALPTTFVLSVIGGLFYIPSGIYAQFDAKGDLVKSNYDANGYASQAKLLTFADLLGTWTSLFVISFIVCSIFGGLINRYTKKVPIKKHKAFVPCAIVSVSLTSLSLLFTVAEPFINIGLLVSRVDLSQTANYNMLISNILLVIVLFVFGAITFVPVGFEERLAHKHLAKLLRLRNLLWWHKTKVLAIAEMHGCQKNSLRFKRLLKAKLGADADLVSELVQMPWALLFTNTTTPIKCHAYAGVRFPHRLLASQMLFDTVVGHSLSRRIRVAERWVQTFAAISQAT